MTKKLLFILFFIGLYHTAFAQAPGNDCNTAVPLTLAPGTTMSTGLQTITGPPTYTNAFNGVGCGTAFPGLYAGGREGVYSMEVVNAGEYRFGFANNGVIYKSLSVHSACPTDNDDVIMRGSCLGGIGTAATRDVSLGYTIPLTLTPGTYYIVIDCWPAGAGTSDPAFELLITSPIANDDCSGAIELFSDVNCSLVTYTNADATASAGAPAPGCANYQGGDVWFTYEVNFTGEFTVTTEPGVMTDSGMAVYSGTCGSLTQLACDDNFGTGLMSSITVTGRTPGEIVYIRLWEYGNNNNGTFDICITTPIPPGDTGVFNDCPNERSQSMTSDFSCPAGVNTSDTVFGNLDGQPTANRLPIFTANSTVCAFAGTSTRYEEINFTVPTTQVYVLEMTAGFDGMAYIVETGFTPGVCASGTFVVGDDDSGPGLRPELTISLTAGVNYTLITTEFGLGSGNSPYSWNVLIGPDINWTTASAPLEWYTASSGGSPIETGPSFNPVNYPGSGLTDTSVPGIYSYWYACPSAPGVRTRVDYVIGKHWKGDTSSDWNNPLNWYGDSVPTDTQCLFIPAGTPNDPVIPDDVDGDGLNLTIETGATLTLAPESNANGFGASLTIQDYITIQGATPSLIVEDGANLIQVNDTPSIANSGNILVNRNTDIRRSDYVYYSSPVQGFDVSDVYGGFTPTNRIYEWIPTTATGYLGMPGNIPIVVGDWNGLSSGVMDLGKGYAVRGPVNQSVGISPATATFDGPPNNGVITQAISSGGYSGGGLMYNPYGTNSLSVTPLDDNWNLIGNPYPSAIDADSFLLANTMLEGTVHIWTHGSAIGAWPDSFYDDYVFTYNPADYITYNLMGATVPFSGKIASGQGFFVLALNDNESGSVTFDNSMRDRTHGNTDFYRMSEPNQNELNSNSLERSRIWLNLAHQNGMTSNTLVGYIEGATQEKDRLFDAYSREVNGLNIYSKIGDERMTIQGRGLPFDENDEIPLGTVIPQAGEYTIALNNVDGLFLEESQDIYLEDTHLGIIHNLKATPYTFTETQAVDYGDRFFLRFTNEALSIDDFELNALSIIAPKGAYIKIDSDSSLIDSVIVYDLLGRTLHNESHIDATEFVINNHNLPSGAYIVQATLSNGQSKTQKVVLKR
ncbi:T9SS sorting signal type C domain-containing protein [Psychroserpens mesophilus]|uniref:T9SS sorting signal type C domain-containing protein n=1 Tax=Psychroserpens mesophilus TaxID=325473 RepID=UPI003D646F8E